MSNWPNAGYSPELDGDNIVWRQAVQMFIDYQERQIAMANDAPRTDWTTADAATIRRAVAEKLGYEVRYFGEPTEWHEDGWVLYKNECHVAFEDPNTGLLEARVYTDEESVWKNDTPDYPHDIGASLALPIGDGYHWNIHPVNSEDGNVRFVEIVDLDPVYGNDISLGVGEHAELAHAACIAWLAYMDYKA